MGVRLAVRAPQQLRAVASETVGLTGIALYNWWVIAALNPAIRPTPDALFSDIETAGHPYAALFSRLDVLSGLLIVAALLIRGPVNPAAQRERLLLFVFGAAAAVGGIFPYTCAEGTDPSCRQAEWSFQLPWQHYVHVFSGIVEFGAATIAIVLVAKRLATTDVLGRVARALRTAMVVGYPLLAAAYLTDRDGAFVEPLFFLSFSAVALLVLFEPAPGEPVPAWLRRIGVSAESTCA
jgi:hypothetical protein